MPRKNSSKVSDPSVDSTTSEESKIDPKNDPKNEPKNEVPKIEEDDEILNTDEALGIDKKQKTSLNSYQFSNYIFDYLKLVKDDEKAAYELHYLCRANPRSFESEDMSYKKYYCTPVSIAFVKKKYNEKNVITNFKYDDFRGVGYRSIIISEKTDQHKFQTEPNKPFWLRVNLKEQTITKKDGNGDDVINKFYYTKIDQTNVTEMALKCVKKVEEKYFKGNSLIVTKEEQNDIDSGLDV
jgi:hypothetical protein